MSDTHQPRQPSDDGPKDDGERTARILSVATSASPSYSAAAAKGAATALVRMFVERGVFGPAPFHAAHDPEEDTPARPAPTAEVTGAWDRARSAVALAESRRTATEHDAPAVTSARLMGRIIGQTIPYDETTPTTEDPARAA